MGDDEGLDALRDFAKDTHARPLLLLLQQMPGGGGGAGRQRALFALGWATFLNDALELHHTRTVSHASCCCACCAAPATAAG